MSLSVEVSRGLGDNPGPRITVPYYNSEAIYQQVGRVAIDQSATGLKLATITLPGMRRSIRPGRVIRIIDTADEYRAKLTSIQYSVGRQEGIDGKPFALCSMGLRMLKVS